MSAATGALTKARVMAAASTNATSVKASAGRLYEIHLCNTSAALKFVKFYIKTSAPTVGTDCREGCEDTGRTACATAQRERRAVELEAQGTVHDPEEHRRHDEAGGDDPLHRGERTRLADERVHLEEQEEPTGRGVGGDEVFRREQRWPGEEGWQHR